MFDEYGFLAASIILPAALIFLVHRAVRKLRDATANRHPPRFNASP
ncbi:hypothetical protein [Methylomagnum ishizawai]|nr:hypothetical protein [Methylomagnum ishizawai]